MAEIKVTSENFSEEVIKSDIPVLADFYADWCGPCKMLSPILSEIAEEYEGTLKVVRINVDDEPDLAGSFSISSIPALMYIKNGQLIASQIGYVTKEELESKLKEWE